MFTLKMKPPVLLALAIGLIAVLAACGNGQERTTDTNPAPQQQEIKIDPADAAKLEQMARSADDMYKLTVNGSYLEARSKLLDIGQQAARIRYDGVTSIEGVQALTETLSEAQRSFNAVRPDPEEAKLRAAKVKLATDALTHKNEPMWLQYDKVLQENARAVEASIQAQDAKQLQASIAALKHHYQIIRPAVLISREPQINVNMESLLTFLTEQSQVKPLPMHNLERGADQLRDAMNRLFGHQDESAYVPVVDQRQPILWTVVLGSVIGAILAFAAWQMFQDGRGEVSLKRKE
ncbi:sporulation protein YpjB [Paenibacillus chartarius]|uniref:Sporulation protein YpjB n=1 Tax=Paenibacillus chartarius TaxID=747481 RepID=A0ABV6DQA0_9BACL